MKNILIFKKLVEKYFKKYIKNTINISNITKYVLKRCRKPKPKPYLTWRCSVFDCLPIIIY